MACLKLTYRPEPELRIVHTKKELTLKNSSKNLRSDELYLYNGKELQEDLDWYDYGWRMYDPSLARFMTLDPLAEDYSFQSPYLYAYNNPIRFTDYMGMGGEDEVKEEEEEEAPIVEPEEVKNDNTDTEPEEPKTIVPPSVPTCDDNTIINASLSINLPIDNASVSISKDGISIGGVSVKKDGSLAVEGIQIQSSGSTSGFDWGIVANTTSTQTTAITMITLSNGNKVYTTSIYQKTVSKIKFGPTVGKECTVEVIGSPQGVIDHNRREGYSVSVPVKGVGDVGLTVMPFKKD